MPGGAVASNFVVPPRAYASAGWAVANASAPPWPRVPAGAWEPYTFEMLDRLLLPADRAPDGAATLIDIGAFNGPISLYAASIGASVYAVEADPDNYAMLRRLYL